MTFDDVKVKFNEINRKGSLETKINDIYLLKTEQTLSFHNSYQTQMWRMKPNGQREKVGDKFQSLTPKEVCELHTSIANIVNQNESISIEEIVEKLSAER